MRYSRKNNENMLVDTIGYKKEQETPKKTIHETNVRKTDFYNIFYLVVFSES